MPGEPSSKPDRARLTSFHIAASSFAALAGVVIAGWQAFGPSHNEPAQPVSVTLTLPAQASSAGTAPKGDADLINTSSVDLAKDASFTSADKESTNHYSFAQIFDGRPDTYITLMDKDAELNVMVNFPGDAAREVTAISYTTPPGVAPGKLATSVDVMVLPDSEGGISGHPVYSFTLQTTPGTQTFAIPGHNTGKAVWLRIAGSPNASGVAIGDFQIIREHATP